MGSKTKISPQMVVIEGQEKGRVVPISEGTAIIGRSKGDIVIQDPRISRSHVALNYTPQEKKVSFTDLKSLNGTFLNGEEKKSGTLEDGVRLQIGDTVFDFQLSDAVLEPPKELESLSENIDEATPSEPHFGEHEPKLEASLSRKSPPPEKATKARTKARSRVKPSKKQSGLKKFYLSVPPRTRRILLSCCIILAGAVYLWDGGSNEREAVARQIATIRGLLNSGNVPQALTETLALRDKYPSSADVYLLLGDAYIAKGSNQSAVTAYQKFASFAPDHPIVHVKLIRLYLRMNLNKQANDEYLLLAKAIRESGQLLSRGVNEQKLSTSEVLEQYPYIRELFIETAKLFIDFRELNEPPEQLLVISRALQKDIAPESHVGYKLEAQVLFKQNQTKEAVAVLENALKLEPRDRWVIENMALGKFRLQDYDGAEQVIRTWLQEYPSSSKANLIMAYLKFTRREVQEALPYLKKIIDNSKGGTKDKYYPEALFLVGQVMQQGNRNSDALKYVSESCRLGYQPGCQSPLLDQRKPTSPPNPNTAAPQQAETSTAEKPDQAPAAAEGSKPQAPTPQPNAVPQGAPPANETPPPTGQPLQP